MSLARMDDGLQVAWPSASLLQVKSKTAAVSAVRVLWRHGLRHLAAPTAGSSSTVDLSNRARRQCELLTRMADGSAGTIAVGFSFVRSAYRIYIHRTYSQLSGLPGCVQRRSSYPVVILPCLHIDYAAFSV